MSEFFIYLGLGFEHISDLKGYDHMVFILALASIYRAKDWRRVLVLITAFTLGHSITLALSTLNIVNISIQWIEFLIPVTILITAAHNLTKVLKSNPEKEFLAAFGSEKPGTSTSLLASNPIGYAFALFFGLIHGLGFSNYLRAILGREESIIQPLLAFNIGLELGQILILGLILGLNFLALKFLKLNHRYWVIITSGAALAISLILCAGSWPF